MADSRHISDLRRDFYGGNNEAEREWLLEALSRGINAVKLLEFAEGAEVTALDAQAIAAVVAVHDGSASAHPTHARLLSGVGEGYYYGSATPPTGEDQIGNLWFKTTANV